MLVLTTFDGKCNHPDEKSCDGVSVRIAII